MKTFKLKRISGTLQAVFGVLMEDGIPFVVTLEAPWLGNHKGVSCIPDETYVCQRVDSPKFGNTFEVTNVPGRSHILFHKGNTTDDTEGCILVAEQFEAVSGKAGVAQSTPGFKQFLKRLADVNEFILEIVWA